MYGWSEGKWHSRKLRKVLAAEGFDFARNPKDADIIIAHSGGCYLLPEKNSAKYILLIGLPYWSEKHIFKSFHEKLRLEPFDIWWYKKSFYNVVYLLAKIPHWIQMHGAWKKQQLPDHAHASVFLVRNKEDPFAHPEESTKLAKEKGWRYLTIDGQHDDLWINPKPIVEMIEMIQTARLL